MKQLGQSLMSEAFKHISAAPGSAGVMMSCLIKTGDNYYRPIKVTKMTVSMDFKNNFSDLIFIYCLIPKGDIVKEIVPFQDNLSIELTSVVIDDRVDREEDEGDPIEVVEDDESMDPMVPITRTYKAYLDDHVDYDVQSDGTTQELENLTSLEVIVFRIEERLVEKLRYYKINHPRIRTSPHAFAVNVLNSVSSSLELEEDDAYKGINSDKDFRDPWVNWSINLPAGTNILEVPDLMQNEMSGMYRHALGFYIRHGIISMWGLYNLEREDQDSFKGLRIFVAPDSASGIIENTWRIPEGAPDWVEIWAVKILNVEDDSLTEKLNEGVGTRSGDPTATATKFVEIRGNTVTASVDRNTSAKSAPAVVDGTQNIAVRDTSENLYLQDSRIAKGMGMRISLLWKHSHLDIISPGMYVELYYDFQGEIRSVKGSLLGVQSLVSEQGRGPKASKMISYSVITIFVDRDIVEFTEYLENSANPKVDDGLLEA